jgi:hypothetical protein
LIEPSSQADLAFYVGAAEKNVYLFAPTEAERDLIVQALCAFPAASPPNGSA